jgi:hypothetical protein
LPPGNFNQFQQNFDQAQQAGGMFAMFVTVMMVLVGSLILIAIIRSISNSARNASLPIQIEPAKVVTKRFHVSGGGGGRNDMAGSPVWENYYVTFELQNGERIELGVKGPEYGMLAEGDIGELTYQGTWYKGFQRNAGARLCGPGDEAGDSNRQ